MAHWIGVDVIILLIVLASIASIAAYFVVGVLSCRYTVPPAIERGYRFHKEQWNLLGEDRARTWGVEWGAEWRILTVWLWWIAVPVAFLKSNKLIRSTESYAPWAKQAELDEMERRIKQREREIAKLERELGIGR